MDHDDTSTVHGAGRSSSAARAGASEQALEAVRLAAAHLDQIANRVLGDRDTRGSIVDQILGSGVLDVGPWPDDQAAYDAAALLHVAAERLRRTRQVLALGRARARQTIRSGPDPGSTTPCR